MDSSFQRLALVLCSLTTFATVSQAAEDGQSNQEMSAEEVARELANPNANLGFLAFQLDYTTTLAIYHERVHSPHIN